jgi:hypothetical protein
LNPLDDGGQAFMTQRVGPLVTLLAVAAVGTMAQAQAPLLAPVCDGKFGMCRYVDRTTRQEIIPARFENAGPFSEGLAAVRVDGRYGYVDGRGEIVIEPKFDFAGAFYQGLAEVVVGRGAGVIDRTGTIVVPPRFQRAVPWTKDVIVVEEGTWGGGRLGAMPDLPGLKGGDHYLRNVGFYHVGGYWVLRPSLAGVRWFGSEGAGFIWATRHGREPYGLIASDGTWKIEPEYEYAGALSDGLAVVRQRRDGVTWTGAIDASGKVVIPLPTLALFGWLDGWGMARESYQSGKYALLDMSGKVLGGFFDQVRRPEEKGEVATVLIDGRWKGIDRAGNLGPNPRNGRVAASCPNAFRIVEIDGLVQITDAQGEPTTPYLFKPLSHAPGCNRPFAVSLDGKWGFAGTDGRLLSDPLPFDYVHGFDGDYAVVQQDKKWGVIDTSGRFALPPRYDQYRGRREWPVRLRTGQERELDDRVGRRAGGTDGEVSAGSRPAQLRAWPAIGRARRAMGCYRRRRTRRDCAALPRSVVLSERDRLGAVR